MRRSHIRISGAALLLLVVGTGCHRERRFSTTPPMRRDDGDFTPFAPRPRAYRSPEVWDTIDNTFFGPLGRILAVERAAEAIDVNALDEVPDSSWFTNRIGMRDLSREDLVRGACTGPPIEVKGPWKVVGGKPNGKNPGFRIEAADGRRYLIKLDRSSVRPSSADVIGSLVYHAAGFNVPCNEVVFFDPSILRIAPGARVEDFVGNKIPLTAELLAESLKGTYRRSDGTCRASASLLLEGKPLGPWRDFGTRPEDPNDVVPHEDRRELRGSYVLAAWLDHYDAREQNSLTTWVVEDHDRGTGWVKHYFIDFGDCLGSLSAWPRVSRRRGVAYELDFGIALVELLTLGVLDRPWQHARFGPTGRTLGYYDVRRFRPDRWRTAYPYGPFTRMTERDAAWMARILARFSRRDVEAMVDRARIDDESVHAEIVRVLLGRREKLLRRFLGRLSPLTEPLVDGDALCLRDTSVEAGIRTGPARVCTPLPAQRPDYYVIRLRVGDTRPIAVYLSGSDVIGIER